MSTNPLSHKCVAIIPARGGSRAIPGKNIMDFCGKPLIAWTIEQARASKHINKVYVTTDDKKIGRISRRYGAEVIERPANIATDISTSEEAILHAISKMEKYEKINIVIFLQATSPLRAKDDIDRAIEKFHSENADSLFSGSKIEDYFIWEKRENNCFSVTYDYHRRRPRHEIKPQYLENGSIYIFRPSLIKKEVNRLWGRIVVYEMPFWKSFQLDKHSDLEICEYYMRKKLLRKGTKDAG